MSSMRRTLKRSKTLRTTPHKSKGRDNFRGFRDTKCVLTLHKDLLEKEAKLNGEKKTSKVV